MWNGQQTNSKEQNDAKIDYPFHNQKVDPLMKIRGKKEAFRKKYQNSCGKFTIQV